MSENYPMIPIGVMKKNGDFHCFDFLIDTGFNAAISFSLDSHYFLLELLNVFQLKKSTKKTILADGRSVETFIGKIAINFNEQILESETLFIEAEKMTHPVIGIEFLKQTKSHLDLNFKKNTFNLK